MDRREFLTSSGALLALLGTSVLVSACSSDDDSPAAPTSGPNFETGTASGGGHSHSGTISEAQLLAGAAVTVTFMGSGHTHDLDLTSGEVQDIAMGTRVEKTVTVGHEHTYVFNP